MVIFNFSAGGSSSMVDGREGTVISGGKKKEKKK